MHAQQPKPIAIWDPARDVWTQAEELNMLQIFERSGVYSGTLPKQGTTLNGILYELPISGPHTEGSGSSSPRGQGKPANQDWEDVPLLMTPLAAEAEKAVSGQSVAHREGGGHQAWLTNQVMDLHRKNEELLPTPAVNDMGAAYTPETWDAWTEKMKQAHGNGNGHGKSLNIEALRLLPTATVSDANGAGIHGNGGMDLRTTVSLLPTPEASQSGSTPEQHLARKPGRSKVTALNIVAEHQLLPTPTSERPDGRNQWGEYAPAIARWETIFGHPAPAPTLPTGREGKHQLSAKFVEWLMGLPAGHVTNTGIPRNQQLKALGNGVVPAQAAEAIRRALT